MSLREYRKKRNFKKTPEPGGRTSRRHGELQFVVQKHDASHLHYDFRLEYEGVLVSWAVPKGPSLDPAVKSLAVHVEDHPLGYADFEGIIPQGEYGGGTVIVWDRGTWEPEENPGHGLRRGKLNFRLNGQKLQGEWSLVRMHGRESNGRENWLLFKRQDEFAKPKSKYNVVEAEPQSVISGRTIAETAKDKPRVWHSHQASRQSHPKPKHTAAGVRNQRPSKAKPHVEFAEVPGAHSAPLPRKFSPQLATLVQKVPEGDNWLHELKFDGYRILAWINDDGVRLISRNGKDWTHRFPSVAEALSKMSLPGSILDGEVVALDERGLSSFQRLQNWLAKGAGAGAGAEQPLVYYVFDAPYLHGSDLLRTPLADRKAALKDTLERGGVTDRGVIRYSDFIEGHGDEVVQQACRSGSEGIVSKLATAPYETGRTRTWVKTKCHRRQEFVIGGMTSPTGGRKGFGALLLGYFEGEKLIYCGRVGTGFTQASLKQLSAQLRKLARDDAAFADIPTGVSTRGVTWVEPRLVCEVEFTEWTEDGMLRHPAFQGLREDKPAMAVGREKPERTPAKEDASPRKRSSQPRSKRQSPPAEIKTEPTSREVSDNVVAGVTITHPDRIIYPEEKLTKLDLAEYCADVGDWILPHLIGRPLSLVRCPQGLKGPSFYQKHGGDSMPEAVHSVRIKEKSGSDDYVVIDDLAGLVSLVQMGVLEFHPWGARGDDVEKPDRLIFDLDPDPTVGWEAVLDGAQTIREILDSAGLASFVRTSGGKGLHIVVPLARRNDWDEVGSFAEAVAQSLAQQWPDRYTANMRKVGRKGRIFIDYLRNRRGATAVASYSPRARPHAPVATPLRWDELSKELHSDHFTVGNVRARLKKMSRDPWKDFFTLRQSLSARVLKAVAASTSGQGVATPTSRRKSPVKRPSRKARASGSKS